MVHIINRSIEGTKANDEVGTAAVLKALQIVVVVKYSIL